MSQGGFFGGGGDNVSRSEYKDKDKPSQIRFSNITAGKGYLFHLKLKIIYFYISGIRPRPSLVVE